ncbi:ABC transporter ATP-binding protein [Kribbella sandramycini]|uniref:ABC transporter ATP-binding protein n=1 Tax=Kribbella sandramycini TaxID=60450 RepID=A0A7Y4L6F5_9ACTN|nr:ABC transporter ATP-binding protein [Kribbella sandramycini]MBB6570371.1 ATP-binding cassette subfamily B protein [Kribbella sandramycini]NOL45233.1 ABC transporter ATP-binding protein [Kribbella sandramycini]
MAERRWENVRTLWSFVRPHRRTLALGLALGLGTTAAGLATPMVSKAVLDGLAASTPIGPIVALLIGLLVLSSGLGLVQWILLGRMGERVVLDARSSMVRRLFRVRVGELAGRSPGELVTRVTSDTVLLREAAASSLVELVNGTIMLVGSLVLMAVLDLVLLATTLGALIVVGLIIAVLMPPMAKAQEQAQGAVGRLGGALEGALRAIRTVKASRAEGRESERVISEATESARQSVRAVRYQAVAMTIAGFGIGLATMLILGLGAWRVSEGALAVSALVAFLLYTFQLMEPVMSLTTTVTSLQSGVAAATRIREIEAFELEAQSEGGVRRPSGDLSASALTFEQVTARYAPGAATALQDVSLEIPRIGHTAIVGPSGAGKTTMFSLLLRFLNPESGRLVLDGIPLNEWSLEDLRRRIVYVEQDTPLVPGTLRENLRYTHQDATEETLWEALRAVRLDERVHELPEGLDTVLSTAVISGGERQRIALARALVSTPEILLLDEATAQLDGLTEAAVHDVIARVARTGAVLTIAHRLSTVIDADQIVVLESGAVRARGTHTQLLSTDSLYQDLVAALRITTTVS